MDFAELERRLHEAVKKALEGELQFVNGFADKPQAVQRMQAAVSEVLREFFPSQESYGSRSARTESWLD